jgi:hypothetical protein
MSNVSNPIFQNYDYTSDVDGDETSPGGGLYHGPMSRFKSVEEFLKKKRKKSIATIKLRYEDILFKLSVKNKYDELLKESGVEDQNWKDYMNDESHPDSKVSKTYNQPLYTIKFRPMEVDNYVQNALYLIEPVNYTFNEDGSIVKLTPHKLARFLQILQEFVTGLENEMNGGPNDADLKKDIDSIKGTIEHVEKYIINDLSIAQASQLRFLKK